MVQAVLGPVAPEDPATAFRPRTRYEAMAQDTAELQGGGSLLAALEGLQVPTTLLWSRRGLFHEEPGLYTPAYLEQWRGQVPALAVQMRVHVVPETNHDTILMAQAGAQAVADRVRAELDGPRQDSQRAGGERPVR